jgi:hypothetical protein
VYLLTPDLAKSLQQVAQMPLEVIKKSMEEVCGSGNLIDRLNLLKNQSFFLNMLRVKAFLGSYPVANDSLYSYIVSTQPGIMTSVTVLLLSSQKDPSAAHESLKSITEKLGAPGTPGFEATLTGFVAAESAHKLPREDADLIRTRLTPYLNNDKLDPTTKALISLLTN